MSKKKKNKLDSAAEEILQEVKRAEEEDAQMREEDKLFAEETEKEFESVRRHFRKKPL